MKKILALLFTFALVSTSIVSAQTTPTDALLTCYHYTNLSTYLGAKNQNIKSVEFIKNLQVSLIKLGYSNVTVSGKYDKYTNQSIIDYKNKRNMNPANSEISARFIDAISADVGCTKSGELFAKIWKKNSTDDAFSVSLIDLSAKNYISHTSKVERNTEIMASIAVNTFSNNKYPVEIHKKEIIGLLTMPATLEKDGQEYEVFRVPPTYNCENTEVVALASSLIKEEDKYRAYDDQVNAAESYSKGQSFAKLRDAQRKTIIALQSKFDVARDKCLSFLESSKKNTRYFSVNTFDVDPFFNKNKAISFEVALKNSEEAINRNFIIPNHIPDGIYKLEIKSPTKKYTTGQTFEVKGGEFVPKEEMGVQDRLVSIELPKNVLNINETNSISVTVKEGVSPTGINVFIADVIGDGSINKNISKKVVSNVKIVDGKISLSPKQIAYLPTNTGQKFVVYLEYKNGKEALVTNNAYFTTEGAKDVKDRVVKIRTARVALVKDVLNINVRGSGFTGIGNSLSLRVNKTGAEDVVIPAFAVGLGGTTGVLSWNVPVSRTVCEQGNVKNCYTFPQSATDVSYEISVKNAGGESEFFPLVATSIGAKVAPVSTSPTNTNTTNTNNTTNNTSTSGSNTNTTNNTSGTSGVTGSGSGGTTNISTGDSGTSVDTPSATVKTLTLTVPKGYASVAAGKGMRLTGTIKGIPNTTKIKVYLKGPDGEVFLKETQVFYCPVAGGDCYGIKSPLGMPLSIPANTVAGTYTVRGVVTLADGSTVEDESDPFTVTGKTSSIFSKLQFANLIQSITGLFSK